MSAAFHARCSTRLSTARSCRHLVAPRSTVVLRADPDEDDFEKRLAKLNKSKMPTGVSRKELKKDPTLAEPVKKVVNYDDETLWKEFAPSQKDLAFNLVLAPTLVWIPFSVAAVGRCAFVKYRITDKRIVVKTEAPWKKEESNIGYHEVQGVVGVNRGFGAWGDMVITLDGGDKLEMRSVPEWQEVRDYVLQRKDAIRGTDISQEELLTGKAPKKGFS